MATKAYRNSRPDKKADIPVKDYHVSTSLEDYDLVRCTF